MQHIPDPEYFPKFWELLVMVAYVGLLLAAGHLIRLKWIKAGEAVPIAVAVLMWLGMFFAYSMLTGTFYVSTSFQHAPLIDGFNPPVHVLDRRLVVLFWCFLFWIPPVAYYTYIVVNSLAVRTVDHIGPFSAHIDDPSEFSDARRLALRGDVNGAVAMYRSYTDNQAGALVEAARLLKSEDRFQEAIELFEEVAQRSHGNKRVWAEAVYHAAKIKEVNLHQTEEAIDQYQQILKRAAETRYGQLACADLARLQVLSDRFLSMVQEAGGETPRKKPRANVPIVMGDNGNSDDAALVVPPADPFYKPSAGLTAGKDGAAAVPVKADLPPLSKPKQGAQQSTRAGRTTAPAAKSASAPRKPAAAKDVPTKKKAVKKKPTK